MSFCIFLPGDCPELQLYADAGSPLSAVGRHPGARERHSAQDLRSAVEHQTHLLRRRQQGDRSPAGQRPAARAHRRLPRTLRQKSSG